MQRVLFTLGEPLESRLKAELGQMIKDEKLKLLSESTVPLSFEDYCTVGGIAVKYSLLRVQLEQQDWAT